ncbi:aldehyde dehydrogenase [Leifsonia xyli subsp. cynodontis DSM 46306]|uniref:Aldehyde dehydrogenase domain-containing protein n=1 Tax=Leifsonia xyli subsp. cynodontis DSM 46306 TaxID=1389489 RepID=U3P822_LEIXC|nr:aldehyde dehydrogenase family protein [Leifsonia xyli]AGW41087.1 aldehyde dehydrogenase [Leifsonia xyli subsp. cynodontis DSM 46306]
MTIAADTSTGQLTAIDRTRTLVPGGTIYTRPGVTGSLVPVKTRYENFIGGDWVAPVKGGYGHDIAPATADPFAEYPSSTVEDIDLAVAAAQLAFPAWAATPMSGRAAVLIRVADRLQEHLEALAVLESWENGKPVRETLAADIPLAIDHFRYFAAAIRAQEGSISAISKDLVSYHYYEPIGVVAQIIPWNFPILMAAWKLAPALAAGNTVVLKPASATPISIIRVMELIQDILPAGTVNVINGSGSALGQPLVEHDGIGKVAFTGSTATGRQIMQYAIKNIIPSTMELGGKSPNLFFDDVADQKDDFYRKAIEGFTLFALNKGEICSCPSRALIQDGLAAAGFLDDAIARVNRITVGDPLDTRTEMGPQNSRDQLDKISAYLDLGPREGCEVLAGGAPLELPGDLSGGYYIQPTVFKGRNDMRVFQEEIFGPVVTVATFTDYADAIRIANDTIYGLGSAVWSRDGDTTFAASQDIKAGRVWVNTYHQYPAGAGFGGYKQSGYGRETDQQTLHNYQEVKNVLDNHDPKPLGFFA